MFSSTYVNFPLSKFRFFALIFICVSLFGTIYGQTKCFSDEDSKRIIESIKTPQKVSDLKSIQSELTKLDSARKTLENSILSEKNNADLIEKRRSLLKDGILRLCTIYKENGWISKESLGQNAFSAEMDLIFNVELPNTQREFLPILIAASEKGDVKNLRSTVEKLVKENSDLKNRLETIEGRLDASTTH